MSPPIKKSYQTDRFSALQTKGSENKQTRAASYTLVFYFNAHFTNRYFANHVKPGWQKTNKQNTI